MPTKVLTEEATDKEYDAFVRRVAANIKKLRQRRGLTQEQMWTEHGFNYRFYQRLESGTHSFSLFTLFKLAKVFRVKISELLK